MSTLKLELEPFRFDGMSDERPMVIAGPCSAESEMQMVETAKQIAALGIKIFRAGIWKPRTRPNSFEGYGSKALPWLKSVKEETGMLIATEVANVKHVYESLKAGVDILWIGARTTANPFSVQEIADTLKGIDIPVMIKNPVNPDVELWIGAIERLNSAGIRRLAAIHRGFSTSEKSNYRNEPNWQIPIELKRRIPELPMITDPSHICGKRAGLLEISQKAMDLNFSGLIIETHINPDEAMSDAAQQLTPSALGELLHQLIIRNAEAENGSLATLEELRVDIDKNDDLIMDILEIRMKIAEQIGQYKKEHNISILQSKRWDSILQKRTEIGFRKGLSNEFIETVFKAIHEESINHQTKVMGVNKEHL